MTAMKGPEGPSARVNSLDGLRGVAASVVVMHHLLLTQVWFADRVDLGVLGAKKNFTISIHTLFEYTPLHVFYGGTEAVVIFFVLSGYVLINSVNKSNLSSYVRNRLVRLYVPIIAAALLASALVKAISHKKLNGASWWLNAHANNYGLGSMLKNMWVVDGTDWLDSSLWSMRYEIIFSLCVMVFAGFVFKASTRTFVKALAAVGIAIYIGLHFRLDLLSWLPVFFAGSSLHWLGRGKYWGGGAKAFIGWIVMFIPWYFAAFGYSLNAVFSRLLMMLGAVAIVDACRDSGNVVSRVLSSKPFQSAGKYSYSLYLVHAPILTAVWFAMGVPSGHVDWLLRASISCLFIVIGTLFVYHLAEKPSLRWIHSNERLGKEKLPG
jgi:peptidoglycan/LPS O-acetylase OafA/YrhL